MDILVRIFTPQKSLFWGPIDPCKKKGSFTSIGRSQLILRAILISKQEITLINKQHIIYGWLVAWLIASNYLSIDIVKTKNASNKKSSSLRLALSSRFKFVTKIFAKPIGSMYGLYIPTWTVDFHGKLVAKYSIPMDTLPKKRWTFRRSYVSMPSSPIVATFRDRCSEVTKKKSPEPSRRAAKGGRFRCRDGLTRPFCLLKHPLEINMLNPSWWRFGSDNFPFWVSDFFGSMFLRMCGNGGFHQSRDFFDPPVTCRSPVETLVFWSFKTPKCFVLFFCFPFFSLDICSRFPRFVEISLWTLRLFSPVFSTFGIFGHFFPVFSSGKDQRTWCPWLQSGVNSPGSPYRQPNCATIESMGCFWFP